MKKHLVASAVAAAFAVPAMAQVTISGTVDTSVQSLKKNGTNEQSQSVVNSSLRSTSNIRISGSEDLGGGLRATFLLEEALAPDTASSGADASTLPAPSTLAGRFNRGAMIGLSGGFGAVNIGTLNSTFISAMDTYMNFGGNINALGTGDGRATTSSITATSASIRSRPQNSVQFISPTFNGVSANVVYSAAAYDGEGTTSTTKDHGKQTQFNLTGKVGNLSFIVGTAEEKTAEATVTGSAGAAVISNGTHAATFTNTAASATYSIITGSGTSATGTLTTTVLVSRVAAVAARTGKIRNDGLGVSYDFGAAQVTYNMLQGKRDRSDITGDQYKFRSQGVHLQVPVGAYSTFLSFREFENKTGGADHASTDFKAVAAGVTYNLSKRTNVYAVYDKVTNDSAAQATTRGGTRAGVGTDPSQIGIGLRHSF